VVYDDKLASRVRGLLAAQAGVEEKKMFGGVSFMVAGQMCCGVLKNDLVVRIPPEQFDDLLAQPHVRPFDFTGRPTTGMVYVAGDGLSSDQALATWIKRGVDFVTAHPRTAKQLDEVARWPPLDQRADGVGGSISAS
jgi:TfoX/Sxy family transcriptional regulator of competence genes